MAVTRGGGPVPGEAAAPRAPFPFRRARRYAATGVVILAILGILAAALATFWFGIQVRSVLTGSMRPTYGPGWAVITRTIPVRDVRPGMIIEFTPPGHTAPLVHRVVTVSGPADAPVVTTKGDANPAIDPWHARLIGSHTTEVIWEVPVAGTVIVDLRSHAIPAIVIGICGACLAFDGGRAILRRRHPGSPSSPQPQPRS
jgi:signal peptidase I